MSKRLEMTNGHVVDPDAPDCPECGSVRVDHRRRLGPSEYYICENRHTFTEADL